MFKSFDIDDPYTTISSEEQDVKNNQQENLRILADYLDALPEGYLHFDMESFYYNPEFGTVSQEMEMKLAFARRLSPGTVMCGIGHAPFAGIAIPVGATTWNDYAEIALGVPADSVDFKNVFDGGWFVDDNTPQGCAARIRKHLL